MYVGRLAPDDQPLIHPYVIHDHDAFLVPRGRDGYEHRATWPGGYSSRQTPVCNVVTLPLYHKSSLQLSILFFGLSPAL